MSDFVPEEELDYDEIYRRGGHNCGDENFALLESHGLYAGGPAGHSHSAANVQVRIPGKKLSE